MPYHRPKSTWLFSKQQFPKKREEYPQNPWIICTNNFLTSILHKQRAANCAFNFCRLHRSPLSRKPPKYLFKNHHTSHHQQLKSINNSNKLLKSCHFHSTIAFSTYLQPLQKNKQGKQKWLRIDIVAKWRGRRGQSTPTSHICTSSKSEAVKSRGGRQIKDSACARETKR